MRDAAWCQGPNRPWRGSVAGAAPPSRWATEPRPIAGPVGPRRWWQSESPLPGAGLLPRRGGDGGGGPEKTPVPVPRPFLVSALSLPPFRCDSTRCRGPARRPLPLPSALPSLALGRWRGDRHCFLRSSGVSPFSPGAGETPLGRTGQEARGHALRARRSLFSIALATREGERPHYQPRSTPHPKRSCACLTHDKPMSPRQSWARRRYPASHRKR